MPPSVHAEWYCSPANMCREAKPFLSPELGATPWLQPAARTWLLAGLGKWVVEIWVRHVGKHPLHGSLRPCAPNSTKRVSTRHQQHARPPPVVPPNTTHAGGPAPGSSTTSAFGVQDARALPARRNAAQRQREAMRPPTRVADRQCRPLGAILRKPHRHQLRHDGVVRLGRRRWRRCARYRPARCGRLRPPCLRLLRLQLLARLHAHTRERRTQ